MRLVVLVRGLLRYRRHVLADLRRPLGATPHEETFTTEENSQCGFIAASACGSPQHQFSLHALFQLVDQVLVLIGQLLNLHTHMMRARSSTMKLQHVE